MYDNFVSYLFILGEDFVQFIQPLQQ